MSEYIQLDVECTFKNVVEVVYAERVRRTQEKKQQFIIAGSYASYLYFSRYQDFNLNLIFNDVDVYFGEFVDYNEDTSMLNKPSLVSQEKIHDTSLDKPLNFVKMRNLSLIGLIRTFDINAISVGFKCIINESGKLQQVEWHTDTAFDDFAEDEKHFLKLRNDSWLSLRPSCFIRLIHKHKQLKLPLLVPLHTNPEKTCKIFNSSNIYIYI